MEVRLQKFLAMEGVCSRRQAEELIMEGRVRVNNKVVSELGMKIDPERDVV
ncbi:MAG: S4 domain-containing protein, partial [bacterium]|nr:S4 domain-containing protein [bacterium]